MRSASCRRIRLEYQCITPNVPHMHTGNAKASPTRPNGTAFVTPRSASPSIAIENPVTNPTIITPLTCG